MLCFLVFTEMCKTQLQLVKNSTPGVLTGRHDYITPVLAARGLLPVRFRIDFKVTLIT